MGLLTVVHDIGERLKTPNYTIDRLPFQFQVERRYPVTFIEAKKIWEQHLLEVRKDHNFDLYVNIPFCIRKCTYCQERSQPLDSASRLGDYIEYLRRCSMFFGPAFKDVRFNNLYVGGGTPSVLKAGEIESLFRDLFKTLRLRKDAESTFELNPASISQKKLEVLRETGFNRLSFGVQSMNQPILVSENRWDQDPERVERMMAYAKRLGFIINTDLILGLREETDAMFLESFKRTLRAGPESVTVTRLNPTKTYLESAFGGDKGLFYSRIYSLFDSVGPRMRVIAESMGYDTAYLTKSSMQYKFAKKGIGKFNSLYENVYPYSCFGIGWGADSRLFSAVRMIDSGGSANFDPSSPDIIVNDLGADLEMYLYLFKLFSRDDPVSLDGFSHIFGFGLLDRLGEQVDLLRRLGKADISDGNLMFTPGDDRSKFYYSLLFFDKHTLVRKWLELTRS